MELEDESSIPNFEENNEEKRMNGEDKEVEETIELPKEEQRGSLSPKSIGSSSNSNLGGLSSPTKGKGLKKWKRIRRNLSNDASGGVDSSLILKRRLSLNEPHKVKNADVAEPETPVASVDSLRSVEAGGFSIGVDSDNSEDRSSKSSTAASVPKARHEIGFGRERTRIKNVGGRGGGNSMQQRAQRGRGGGVDASKKIRGNRTRIEEENSQSSVESDLRSSNVGFTRWGSGVNGKHGEKSLKFDLEHCEKAQTSDEVISEYHKENGVVEDLLREDLDPGLLGEERKVKREFFWPPSGVDPFVESIVMLQAAQEALEAEIQKIGEIGKAAGSSVLDDWSEEAEVDSSPTLAAHLVTSTQKIEHLQYRLDEASATIKAKELRVRELEYNIKGTSTIVPIVEEMRDLEFELEDLLKQKIQAEVEYLIITRTTRSWKVMAEDQIALLEDQKSLAGDQAQVMLKLRDAEDKAIRLKEQAWVLEAHCSKLLQTEKVLRLQNKVCKFSFCWCIQLLLLCAAFGLFLVQLMPPSDDYVPT